MNTKRLLPLLVWSSLAASAFPQGSLTPPAGAPAPTMKTLEQVEPRIPINATTAPGDADYNHIITTAGSYYLTGNLIVNFKLNGIDVRIEGVTIDLNGFEIRRPIGAGGNGIEIDATAHRCTVKNGSIKGLAYGINSLLVGSSYPKSCAFRDLAVSNCTSVGIVAGEGAVLESCRAHDGGGSGISAERGSTLTNCAAYNNGGTGISAGNGSTLTNCSAVGNTALGGYGISTTFGCTLTNCSAVSNNVSFGIFAGSGSTLKNCAARSNTSSDTVSGGIDAPFGCTLIGCAASSNLNSNATASPSTGLGIRILGGSTVRDCTVNTNQGDGIQVAGDGSHVTGNNCTGNASGGQGGGIHLTAATSDCRIEGNNVTANVRGIDIDGTVNIVFHNTARGNTGGNYQIVAGNRVGAIVTPPLSGVVAGNSGAAGFATSDPWANFAY